MRSNPGLAPGLRKRTMKNKMYSLKTFVFVMLLSFTCWLTPGCTTREQTEIRIEGSTTLLPFMRKISEAYSQKGVLEIEVSGGGSMKGVSNLIDGKCRIAMSSSPIPTEMLNRAESAGLQIKGFAVATDLIVPIVHPSNPVDHLSIKELGDIYAGAIKSWEDVGGLRDTIEVVTRGASSGTEEIWKEIVMKSGNIQSRALLRNSNSGVLAYVAEHPAAIGYVSHALLNHEVKPLFVNGEAPGKENAKQGKYPISRRLYLYVDQKDMPHDIKKLIVFILSKKGQQIAERCGFIPLNVLN